MTENFRMLDANHPVVQAIVAKEGIKPVAKGEPAIPQGSRQITPKVAAPEKEPKPKRMQINLSVQQEARLIREAAVAGMDAKSYLQQIIDKELEAEIGKPIITGATFMGNKTVFGPSKNYKGN